MTDVHRSKLPASTCRYWAERAFRRFAMTRKDEMLGTTVQGVEFVAQVYPANSPITGESFPVVHFNYAIETKRGDVREFTKAVRVPRSWYI